MYIDPNSTIAGQSAIKIRDFLRTCGHGFWSIHYLAHKLKVPQDDAEYTLRELDRDGYIEFDHLIDKIEYWHITDKGCRLSCASAAKPILRSTAERKVRELLERVKVINNDPQYLYKITKFIVFGSYLSHKERLNDVDFGVYLERKEKDNEKHDVLEG